MNVPPAARPIPIVKAVQKHFGKKLRFVFRNFPLTELHPHAESAAEVAEFAGAQARFWEMHDGLSRIRTSLDRALSRAGRSLWICPRRNSLRRLEKHSFRPKVRADFSGGLRSGVNGAPTFYINGTRLDGALELEDLVAVIDAALERAKA